MAEYIDREKLIPDRCYNEPEGYEAVSCDQIFHEDAADVVQREKINKAIEEIKQEIQNGTIKIINGNEKLFNILKEL